MVVDTATWRPIGAVDREIFAAVERYGTMAVSSDDERLWYRLDGHTGLALSTVAYTAPRLEAMVGE